MARNLAKSGHNLTVFDSQKETAEELLSEGTSWVDSPSAVAAASQVVFTALPRPQDVEMVALGDSGILNGAARGLTYFDLSTTDPDTIHRIAAAAKPKGVHVLDAPVSGGVSGAEHATLCIMIGGDQSVYTRHKAVLELIGEKVIYCGEQGMGAVCKIVNNLINLGNYVLVSEALTLGLKAGHRRKSCMKRSPTVPVIPSVCRNFREVCFKAILSRDLNWTLAQRMSV